MMLNKGSRKRPYFLSDSASWDARAASIDVSVVGVRSSMRPTNTRVKHAGCGSIERGRMESTMERGTINPKTAIPQTKEQLLAEVEDLLRNVLPMSEILENQERGVAWSDGSQP